MNPKSIVSGEDPTHETLPTYTGEPTADKDPIELNVRLAAQVLAVDSEVHFVRCKLNVHGGAISLGHPIGATGARITTTLLHALVSRDKKLGLATLCISGGMGLSLLVERCS